MTETERRAHILAVCSDPADRARVERAWATTDARQGNIDVWLLNIAVPALWVAVNVFIVLPLFLILEALARWGGWIR